MSTKRSFAVDTTSLATAAPILPEGVYAGQIRNASTTMGDYQLITISEILKYPKGSKEGQPTGTYRITGQFAYGVTLTSKKAIKILQRDEPIVFGGNIRIDFTDKFQLGSNHVLGSFLETLGLKEVNFGEDVDWEYNEDILSLDEKELRSFFADEKTFATRESIPDIVDMLNSVTYHRAMFNNIANSVNGQNVKAKIIQKPNRKEKEVKENSISTGTFAAPFCGVLPYTDGAEFDLEEGE